MRSSSSDNIPVSSGGHALSSKNAFQYAELRIELYIAGVLLAGFLKNQRVNKTRIYPKKEAGIYKNDIRYEAIKKIKANFHPSGWI